MSGVNQITFDAITVRRPIAALRKLRHVRGSIPTDPVCRDILNQSGFFEHERAAIPFRRARRDASKPEDPNWSSRQPLESLFDLERALPSEP